MYETKSLLRRGRWGTICIPVAIWLVWFSTADELFIQDLPGRPTLPFDLTEHVKLARVWHPFSRGSLRLACTRERDLRFILQMRSPYDQERGGRMSPQGLEEWLNVPGEMEMRVTVYGKIRHSLPNKKAYAASIRSSIDTIVFAPLSLDEAERLAIWLDETWLKRFSFTWGEYLVSVHGFTSGDSVLTLAHQCLDRSS